MEQTKQDCFETLVEWLETRVQVMEEAREETGDFQKRSDQKQDGRRHQRGVNTSGKVQTCIVSKSKVDHPPRVCGHFKELSVPKHKQLIARCVAFDVLQLDTTVTIAQEAESVEWMHAKALITVAIYTSLLTYPCRGIKTVHQTATITILPQIQS